MVAQVLQDFNLIMAEEPAPGLGKQGINFSPNDFKIIATPRPKPLQVLNNNMSYWEMRIKSEEGGTLKILHMGSEHSLSFYLLLFFFFGSAPLLNFWGPLPPHSWKSGYGPGIKGDY